ncbi:MAG: GUN4 domain-containing protein [Xenococcaceae cyanobacterium]
MTTRSKAMGRRGDSGDGEMGRKSLLSYLMEAALVARIKSHCYIIMHGRLLDRRYRIIEDLGAGSFGQTYIAEDTKRPGNPRCVVKKFKHKSTDPNIFKEAKRLFDLEAKVLEKLGRHDQIPQLLAYFDENQEFYLVQEFIDGHPLSQELIPGNPLSESDAITLLQGILEPLAFIHQNNVIHRDIKPSNIIRRKQDGKLVLIDFGAVKQITAFKVDSQGQTTITLAIGTLGYMPPEQAHGKPKFSSDVYAVGMIGIQALTGIKAQILSKDQDENGEIIWRNYTQVSNRLADVLTTMVRYHFSQRYQNASEALQALRQQSGSITARISNLLLTEISFPFGASQPHSPPQPRVPLETEVGVDYTRLRDLLAAGKWKEADQETGSLMLKAANQEERGWLERGDIEKFPCADLRTIDKLWREYSNGCFGFSVQKCIYQSLGGTNQYNYQIWKAFGLSVGWCVNNAWLYYNQLTFNPSAPKGHLPFMEATSSPPGFGIGACYFSSLVSRIETCEV